MAREDLSVQKIDRDGLSPSFTAAVTDGHSVRNSGREFLHVKNDDASSHTVTVVTPRKVHGLDIADLAVAVPAGEERVIGVFPTGTFGADMHVDYSAVTSVTIAAFRT